MKEKKISHASSSQLFPFFKYLPVTDLLSISMVLEYFLKCHIVGNTVYSLFRLVPFT